MCTWYFCTAYMSIGVMDLWIYGWIYRAENVPTMEEICDFLEWCGDSPLPLAAAVSNLNWFKQVAQKRKSITRNQYIWIVTMILIAKFKASKRTHSAVRANVQKTDLMNGAFMKNKDIHHIHSSSLSLSVIFLSLVLWLFLFLVLAHLQSLFIFHRYLKRTSFCIL